ncbi:hypothetical protein LCC91_07405 [Tepidimonas taiwanensis]|uniref:Uncharacterized protein n=1 Tax=Tepidimonas taiwanensis TaxID=307486 RepID=A0A554XBY7_9BURK|nr:hypothetical protein [Tepidimonas taiwanensis]MCX7693545.1 hypothetical protein [Tepidimonas taiwanensis]MDM7464475.1 hypothetical protein [Tepidimonas taiwanensis]TSE33361.1 hypothetical protein Ttaiw_00614 [Tepidimonas taiwanensis]UBQ04401.1 hypothetical protein LCC91_07405 [Tepidimonas taiwanensis]
MLTISSIAVAPAPQMTPTVRAQPVTPARPGNAVSRDSAGGAVVAPQGEAARVQVQAPPPLAPVTPPQEAQRADGYPNAAAPERTGLPPPTAAAARAGDPAADGGRASMRAAEDGRRAQEAEAQQRAQAAQRRAQERVRAEESVQAREAADERADEPAFPEVKNPALEALDTQIKELLPNMWKASRAAVDMVIGEEARKAAEERAKRLEELQARLNARPLANLPPDEAAQTYGATANAAERPSAGAQIDRLV